MGAGRISPQRQSSDGTGIWFDAVEAERGQVQEMNEDAEGMTLDEEDRTWIDSQIEDAIRKARSEIRRVEVFPYFCAGLLLGCLLCRLGYLIWISGA